MSLVDDLKHFENGKETNFTSQLFRLIAKADMHNRVLLRKSFPNAVKAYEHYFYTGGYLDLPYD